MDKGEVFMARRGTLPGCSRRARARKLLGAQANHFQTEEPNMRMTLPTAALGLATALLGAGCASTPPPTAQLAVAAASIDAARAAGAPQYAAAELNTAQAKLEQARRLVQSRQHGPARELAEQADADAQVARTKSQAERSRLAVTEVREGLRLLQEEAQRGTPPPAGDVPAGVPPPQPLPPATPLPPPAGHPSEQVPATPAR
jgi:hypothetical protein